jgi:hypothetical protein
MGFDLGRASRPHVGVSTFNRSMNSFEFLQHHVVTDVGGDGMAEKIGRRSQLPPFDSRRLGCCPQLALQRPVKL